MKILFLIAAAILLPAGERQAAETSDTSAMVEPIAQAAWLEGRWIGTGMGGEVEEVWSPAVGGQMVGHFSYSRDGKPVFYEILLLRPDAEGIGIEMLVKHFNADFTAWEDKAEWVTFEAQSVGPGRRITMRGLLLEGEDDRLTVTVTMKQADGSVRDVPFEMIRAD